MALVKNFGLSGVNGSVQFGKLGGTLSYSTANNRFEIAAPGGAAASGNIAFNTVLAGNWQGSAIATQYGGLGGNFSASTGILKISSGTVSASSVNLTSEVTGVLPVANGGTGGNTQSTARDGLGLGTIATQAANNVSITGGSINATAIGASTASTGRFSELTFVTGLTDGTINITQFDNDQLLAANSNARLATQQAVKSYVDSTVSASGNSINISGDSGNISIVFTSNTLSLAGTTNQITTTASGSNVSFSLANSVTIPNTLTAGNLTTAGAVTGGSLLIGNASLSSDIFSGLSNVVSAVFTSGNAQFNNGALSGVSTIDTTGNVSVSGSLTVSGNFTVQGTVTTVGSQNLIVDDALIELGKGQTSGVLDTGLVLNRGSDDDVFVGWQESQDRVVFGLGNFDANSNANLSISTFAPLRAGNAQFDSLQLASGSNVTAILNETNMASNSATSLATQSSIKAYVDTSVAGFSETANVVSDSGNVSVNLKTQTLTLSGTSNRITTSGSGQSITFNLANTITGLTSVTSTTFATGTATLSGGTLTGLTALSTGNLQISGSAGITSVVTDLSAVTGNANTSIPSAVAVKDYVDNNSGDGLIIRAEITHNSSANVGVIPDVSTRTYVGSRVVITVSTAFSGNSVDHITVTENNGSGTVLVNTSDADILEAGTYVIDLPSVTLTRNQPIVVVFRDLGGTPVTPTAGSMIVKVEYNWI
jgi:hypothetical protein